MGASQHDEDDDSERPDVGCVATVFFSLTDFWAHVVRCPTAYFELLAWESSYRKSKVNYFQVVPVVDNDVFELEVPMNDGFLRFRLRMQILETLT